MTIPFVYLNAGIRETGLKRLELVDHPSSGLSDLNNLGSASI